MKTPKLVLATLTPLAALGGTLAVADEVETETKEMRAWSAVLSEPSEEAAGATLRIIASRAARGSNRIAIESVKIVSASVEDDDEGNMTETMTSVVCSGPFEVAGGSFMIEAASMEEEGEMAETEEEMKESGEETAEAGEVGDMSCAFAVSGMVSHTYRAWHSWDMAGSVTAGETCVVFSIASAASAMTLEVESEREEMEGKG